MEILIGVDVGQRQERSAFCVAEQDCRSGEGRRKVTHHTIRYLERLSSPSSYPEVARRLGEIVERAKARERRSPGVYVNATGLGEPIVEMLRQATHGTRVVACYLNHGDRLSQEDHSTVRLGKAHLVTQIQALLQSGQLHLPRSPDAETLAQELLDFELKVEAGANERQGAFRVGTQDELVTALGLALVAKPPQRLQIY